MWAQLQKVRTKPGREAELLAVFEQLRAIEQADSGLLRTTVMRSQADPAVMYVLVVFESEEKARAREQDPRREHVSPVDHQRDRTAASCPDARVESRGR